MRSAMQRFLAALLNANALYGRETAALVTTDVAVVKDTSAIVYMSWYDTTMKQAPTALETFAVFLRRQPGCNSVPAACQVP